MTLSTFSLSISTVEIGWTKFCGKWLQHWRP